MFKQISKKIKKDFNKAGKDINRAAKATDLAIKKNITRPIRNSPLIKSTSRSVVRTSRTTRRAIWNFVNKDVVPTVKHTVDRSLAALRAQSRLFKRSLRVTEKWYEEVVTKASDTTLLIADQFSTTSSTIGEPVEDQETLMEDLKIAAKFCILPIIFQELPKVSRVEDFDEINSQEAYGSLMHMAARFGNTALANLIFNVWRRFHKKDLDTELAVFDGDLSIRSFETRKRFGKFVDQENEQGWTALHIACSKGHNELVEWLIRHGASIHTCTPLGTTPLMLAVLGNHVEIVAILLELGADPIQENDCGESAISMAEHDTRLVEIIRSISDVQSLCVICMEKECDTLLVPCHHSTYCFDCWTRALNYRSTSTACGHCPICREDIENIRKK